MAHRHAPRFPQVPLHLVPTLAPRALRPRVLNVSLDRALGAQCSARLQHAGFRVETAPTTEEAARRLQERDFDAVIVGHSLSRAQKAEVIGAARAAESAPWIIGLYYLERTDAVGTHIAIDAQDGAEAIIDALGRLRPRKPQASSGRP